MGFVVGIKIIAKSFAGVIKDHRQMRWLFIAARFTEKLPQHIAKALNGTHGQAVALAGKRREGMIGAENIARTINQIEMVTLLKCGF